MSLDIAAWEGLALGERLDGGARNEVWAGSFGDEPVVVRRSRRTLESLAWELDLMLLLHDRGFSVPLPVPTSGGDLSWNRIVVQRWIDGREPSTDADWALVAAELRRLHTCCGDVAQRPGCQVVTEMTSSSISVDAELASIPRDVVHELLDVFSTVVDIEVSLIHGDPGQSNIRIGAEGRVGLLDWDESRLDVVWHDLSNLGVQVLSDADHAVAVRLSDAWEAANAWTAEPEYARRRLASLRSPGSGEARRPG